MEIYLVKQGKALLPAADSDAEAIAKLKNGFPYKASVTSPRNYKFHKRAFALLNLAFSYWQPDTLISEVESRTVENLGKYMKLHGVDAQAVELLSVGFMEHLKSARMEHESAKDFNTFREYITVKSGFYVVVDTPAGRRKIPKSISYASMDNADFESYYKSILNTCWAICLNSVFESQEQLATELLRFE